MESYLEHLRNKPHHHKQRIALGLASFFTALVFVVWLSVLLPNSASEVIAREPKSTNTETPFSAIKTSVAQAVEATKSMWGDKNKPVDLESEYNRIKGQVESGQIQVKPDTINNQ